MELQMKSACERCQASLDPACEAYLCSYECTFCPDCAKLSRFVCSHCGGELVRRPRREVVASRTTRTETLPRGRRERLLVWGISLGAWGLITLAAAVSLQQFYRTTGSADKFLTVLAMEASQLIPYAVLTPFVYWLALRFPIQRHNWLRRSLLHLFAALVFCLFHVTMRGLTPYAMWDRESRQWVSAFWAPQTHTFRILWPRLRGMYLTNVVDDVFSGYVPILFIAQAVTYYRGLRAKESQALQLEAQLAKARLQSLKNQLQPHFLFNTLHSISALMLTNPYAADRMMTRLSELLRMTLENEGVQLTTLGQELEFVTGYLEIEKIRFEDKLSVSIDVPADLLDASVPQLLLQPLAENAVRHGISRCSGPGWVRITARRESQSLHIRVRDNGTGLTESLSDTSKGGKGIRTTKERLETLFGAAQSFELRNAPEGGVEVNVRIPYVQGSIDSTYSAEQDDAARDGEHEWARKPSGS